MIEELLDELSAAQATAEEKDQYAETLVEGMRSQRSRIESLKDQVRALGIDTM